MATFLNRPAAPGTETDEAATDAPVRNSYDPATPDALCEFMLAHWGERPAHPDAGPLPFLQNYQARRRKLSALYPGEALVIPTGHPKVRANDTFYPFRAGSDFFYLTGNMEPDCVLVFEPTAPGSSEHRDILFVEPTGRTDPSFFTDRAKGELWTGARLGVEGSAARYGMAECRSMRELEGYLAELGARSGAKLRVLRGFSEGVDAALPGGGDHAQFAVALSEMRLLKDPVEVQALRDAIAATQRGFEDVIRALRTAPSERHLEMIFATRARLEGNDVGYGSIVAGGSHACVLHWTRNDGILNPDELLLLDAGVEGYSLYTADITRTLPIGGRFTTAQRRIYDLVYAAQDAAIKAVKPGADFLEPNRVAMRILAQGLHDLGILTVSVEEALREDRQLFRRYTLHNVSHMLGIDVHDCARAREQEYKLGTLTPGMVLTVEPGLYFQPDDLTVPEEYRGIGVRIEDDILVSETGWINLSSAIPRSADDVEAWIANVQA